ncbi:MAG: SDR family oxidoreductase [Pirellulales bacterium]|nr:SDR family oxidoreductase [Pirellulales bacterium]
MKTIRGKKAVVTGAASGIGRDVCLELARGGADLYLIDIDEDGMRQTADLCREHQVEVRSRCCDVSQADEITATVDAVLAEWEVIDILINNAGVAYYGPVTRMKTEQWDWLLAINLHAPIRFTHEFLPVLLSRPEGHVVNMASICGLVAGPRQTAYHVSKFGLVGYTESLRAEFAGKTLGLTCMCPGLVRTPLWKNAVQGFSKNQHRQPPRWAATTSRHVAKRCIAAIRGNKPLVVMTPIAHFLYGLKRISPRFLDFLQRFRLKKRKPSVPPAPRQRSLQAQNESNIAA